MRRTLLTLLLTLTTLRVIANSSSGGNDFYTVRGTVTWIDPWWGFALQDGESSYFVMKKSAGDVNIGSIVEAHGIVRFHGASGEMRRAIYSVKGNTNAVAPRCVTSEELFRAPALAAEGADSLFGRLVSVEGTLEHIEVGVGFTSLSLSADGRIFTVRLRGVPSEQLENWRGVPVRLRVTGACIFLLDDDRGEFNHPSDPVELLLRSEDDIELVSDRTLQVYRMKRAGWVALLMMMLAVITAGFYLLVRTLVLRAWVRQLEAVSRERRRMADDLHDSIEQDLAGIKVLLQTALSLTPNASVEMRGAIEASTRLLAQAKSEIRGTIMNLRDELLFERPPAEIFALAVAKIRNAGFVNVRTKFRGLPTKLPERVLSNFIYIFREAVANAVKHGGAKTVILVTDPIPNGFLMRVLNDGTPFDPASAPGLESGHFGLAGMMDRARHNGISLEWETVDGSAPVLKLTYTKS